MIPKSHLTPCYLWGVVATLVVGCGASVLRVNIDALRARVLAARCLTPAELSRSVRLEVE
ncbi:MAG: hypothetical protein QGH25_11290 [Candidatus Latescibacteria bacterium]|nr:hypothetical protein [Candidatus Latescibacterota bacterium]